MKKSISGSRDAIDSEKSALYIIFDADQELRHEIWRHICAKELNEFSKKGL